MQDNSLAKALALATQLGFAIACPLLAFIAGGAWLDNRLGTVPLFLLVGVLLGVLAAGGALYQLTTVQSRRKTRQPGPGAPYKVERQDQRPEATRGTDAASRRRQDGMAGEEAAKSEKVSERYLDEE